MKNTPFLLMLLFVFSACKDKLPEFYGVYTLSEKSLNQVQPQKLILKGTCYLTFSGIENPKGSALTSVKSILVFEKNLDPKKLFLTKLAFSSGQTAPDLRGDTYIDLNLWTAEKNIEVNIAPVEGKTDMYRIIPVSPLQNGVYALHTGEMTNQKLPLYAEKTVWGFMVGNVVKPKQLPQKKDVASDEYLNDSTAVVPDADYSDATSQAFYDNATNLLAKANNLFNLKSYDELRKLYLNPDWTPINDADWKKLVDGFRNWSTKAGKIKSCTIKESTISETQSTFQIQTVYEKSGLMDEEFDVVFVNGTYYMTFIGTR